MLMGYHPKLSDKSNIYKQNARNEPFICDVSGSKIDRIKQILVRLDFVN
jgi:hypothetical protein